MNTSQIPGSISVMLFSGQFQGITENVIFSRGDKKFGKKEHFRRVVAVSGRKFSTAQKTGTNRLSGADGKSTGKEHFRQVVPVSGRKFSTAEESRTNGLSGADGKSTSKEYFRQVMPVSGRKFSTAEKTGFNRLSGADGKNISKERFRQAVPVSGRKFSTAEKTGTNRLSGADGKSTSKEHFRQVPVSGRKFSTAEKSRTNGLSGADGKSTSKEHSRQVMPVSGRKFSTAEKTGFNGLSGAEAKNTSKEHFRQVVPVSRRKFSTVEKSRNNRLSEADGKSTDKEHFRQIVPVSGRKFSTAEKTGFNGLSGADAKNTSKEHFRRVVPVSGRKFSTAEKSRTNRLSGAEGKSIDKEHFRQIVPVSGRKFSTAEKSRTNRLSRADGKSTSITMRRGVNDFDMVEDRAAFKTFEVFTDIKNRPRILRMEMEERIKNLAIRLNATNVNMPEWQFSQMMHTAKIKFTDHSILRVVQILGEFGNWRRVLQVVEWLQSSDRFKSYKSKYIYTTVLNVLGKAKRPMETLNVFHAMRQDKSSYPDLAAYHCISVTLGQAGLLKELFDVIDCMKSSPEKKFNTVMDQKWNPRLEPDLVIYNAVLNACIQKKHWEGAFWVLQQLKQQGIRPSSATYGLVMEVMLECGKYSLVHEFFKKAEKTCIPNTLTYKVLVNAFWREGKIDEAVLAVQDMERRGIVGSASLYYDLARCLCSAGRCEEALAQVDKICKVAKKPLVVTFTGLIQACLDSGGIQNATYIFNKMQTFCSPNVVTCNILLKSYLEHSMYDVAMDLFRKLKGDDYGDQRKTYLRGRVTPDNFTFNTMMEAAATAEKWDDVQYIFSEMLNHGFQFDERRHLHVVMNAAKAGKVELLNKTWEYLVHSSWGPPVPVVKEWVRVKLKEGDHVSVVSALSIIRNEPKAFSVDLWLDLLELNANELKKDTVPSLILEIEAFLMASSTTQPILENLLQASIKYLRTQTSMSQEYALI